MSELSDLVTIYEELISKVMAAERERCAKIANQAAGAAYTDSGRIMAEMIAAKIRSGE